MLVQMRPQLEAAFRLQGGLDLMNALLANVRTALAKGLHVIFVLIAVLMTGAVVLHAALRNLRLRSHAHAPEAELSLQ
jgi:hypothetical protein